MPYPTLALSLCAVAGLGVATLVGWGLARLGFTPPSPERRIGAIDGLRGYLALLVLAHHFFIWFQIDRLGGRWSAPPFAPFAQFGSGGVCLFFMATGLLFYPQVLKGIERCDWRALYTSRVFRLLPANAVAIGAIFGVISLRTGRTPAISDLPPALLWLIAKSEPPLMGYPDSGRLNAYALWSLHHEWLFYIFTLPACAWASTFLRRRGRPVWLVPLGLLAATYPLYALAHVEAVKFYPSFAIGMLAYECQSRPRLAQAMRARVVFSAAIAALIGQSLWSDTPYGASLPIFAAFFTCVACGADLGGLFRTAGARVLGECSYSIYLLHGIVLDVIFVDLRDRLAGLATPQLGLVFVIAAPVVTLAAAAVYLGVERPFIAWGKVAGRAAAQVRWGQLPFTTRS